MANILIVEDEKAMQDIIADYMRKGGHWWLVIVAVLIISIPFKVKFMKWWSKNQQEKKGQRGKWGDDE